MLIQSFCKPSLLRLVLIMFLIMAMFTSIVMSTVAEVYASSVALAGCLIGGVSLLTSMAILQGSGFNLSGLTTIPLVNWFWSYVSATDRVIIGDDAFISGRALGSSLFSSLQNFCDKFFSARKSGAPSDGYFYNDIYIPCVYLTTYSAYGNVLRPFISHTLKPSENPFIFFGMEYFWVNLHTSDRGLPAGDPYVRFPDGTEKCLKSPNDTSCTQVDICRYIIKNGDSFYFKANALEYYGSSSYDTSNWSTDYGSITPNNNPDIFAYLYSAYDGINAIPSSFEPFVFDTSFAPSIYESSSEATTADTVIYVPTTLNSVYGATAQQIRDNTFEYIPDTTVPDVPDVPDVPTTGETSGTITGTGTGTGVFGDTGSWIWDIPILGNLLVLLNQIWSVVQNLFTSIIGSIVSALENFFLPTEEQFVGFVEDIHNTVDSSGFPSLNSALDFGDGNRPDNVQLTVYGKAVDIVPYDLVDYALEVYFRPIIRGLIWFLLVFYEVNQFSMLFTGRRMFDLASAFGNSKEETSNNQKRGLIKL